MERSDWWAEDSGAPLRPSALLKLNEMENGHAACSETGRHCRRLPERRRVGQPNVRWVETDLKGHVWPVVLWSQNNFESMAAPWPVSGVPSFPWSQRRPCYSASARLRRPWPAPPHIQWRKLPRNRVPTSTTRRLIACSQIAASFVRPFQARVKDFEPQMCISILIGLRCPY